MIRLMHDYALCSTTRHVGVDAVLGCCRIFKPHAVLASNKRIVWGWDHAVTVGVLPISMFASGHVFFTQKLFQVAPASAPTSCAVMCTWTKSFFNVFSRI